LALRAGFAPDAHSPELARWLLWPGVALLTSAALTSLSLQWRTFARALRDIAELRFSRAASSSTVRYLWIAPLGLAAAIIVVGWAGFGLHPVFSLAALLLSLPLSAVCARATGETDIAPITQVGQLTQLSAGALAHRLDANVLAGSIASGAAAQTAQTLWSLKTAALLGANRRSVIRAQLLGIAVGAAVVVPAYSLVVSAYPVGSPLLPAPAAAATRALAEVVQSGFKIFPAGAVPAAIAALFAGALLAFLGAQRRMRVWIPSAVAMGVGFLVPPSFGVTIGLAAVLLAAARAVNAQWTQTYAEAIASGSIAGEALMGVVIAVLVYLRVLQPS
jgi:uncharacterized oligopeptide transporter (OPT) family protein